MLRTGLLIMLILIASLEQGTADSWLPAAHANDVAMAAVAVFDRQALARAASPPLGLPGVPGPDDNPPTAARIHLGRKLFFDRRLSHNNTMSCAMCHVPEQGFTVNEMAQAVGVAGRSLRRNAPTLLNIGYMQTLFHDGRETSLETQVISPLLARDEMANPSMGYVVAKITRLDDYAGLFEQAFQRPPSVETIGQALASYQRTLLAANSPFDRWYYGKRPEALSAAAQKGFHLFMGKARCGVCHTITEQYALFTDQAFHNTGLGWHNSMERAAVPRRVQLAPGVFTEVAPEVIASVGEPRPADLGRYEVTLAPEDRWQYRTPTLRNVAITAPYMHDGSLSTLTEVVQFYNRGGMPHALLDPVIQPLHLTDAEVAALVAFLDHLTGDNIDVLIADARSITVGNVYLTHNENTHETDMSK
jgi:cytochrome c peroxidase